MGLYDPEAITTTNLNSELTPTTVANKDTDIQKWMPPLSSYLGYYKTIPLLKASINKIAIWAAGAAKIKAKTANRQKELDNLTGFGKDTARDIVINLIKISLICGDGMADINKDKAGRLRNLKPLNSGTIEIIANNLGILDHYEQLSINETTKERRFLERWEPNEMFHLPWDRIADEIHGTSVIECLIETIIMDKEARESLKKYMRRMNSPIRIIEVDSDNTAKLLQIKEQYKDAIEKGEVIVVPKESIAVEDHKTENMVKDAIEWPLYLMRFFIISFGVPEVILGSINNKDTEGASKILYLAFEQVIKNVQVWFEEQWRVQIGFEIDLPEPPSVDPMILMDSRKAGATAGTIEQGNKNLDVLGQNK
jgi:hypothetical protein